MNIFVLDKSPSKAAEYHNDKHVVKMILETAQVLSTVYYTTLGITQQKQGKQMRDELTKMYSTFPRENFYALSHLNHPSCKWVQYSIDNWKWLLLLGQELCKEYTKRYGKIHACQQVIEWFRENPPVVNTVECDRWWASEPTIPANATSIKEHPIFQTWEQAISTYRQYYKVDKRHLAQWKTQIPEWYD